MALVLVSGCATTSEIHDRPTESLKHVLVFQFDDKSSYSYGKIPYDASEFMEKALIRTGQVVIISRDEWEAQLAEATPEERWTGDPVEQAIRVGKLVGADAVIIGTIQRFAVDQDHDPDGPIISRRHEYNATTHVKADVFDVESAKKVSTVLATGSAEKRTVRFFREGPISVDAVHERTLLNEALQDATQQLAYKIVKQL